MSADILQSGRSDVIPDYILSRFPLPTFGEMEHEFGRQWADQLVTADPVSDPELWKAEKEFASGKLKERGQFAFGTEAFDARFVSLESVPFVLYLSLRVKHPTITRRAAAALLDDDNFFRVRTELLDLMGYKPPKVQPPTQGAVNPSTSTSSISPSDATGEKKPDTIPIEKSPA